MGKLGLLARVTSSQILNPCLAFLISVRVEVSFLRGCEEYERGVYKGSRVALKRGALYRLAFAAE